MSVSDCSANVWWDLDEKYATISLDKLTLHPSDTPLQIVPDKESPDRSIFKPKADPKKRS